MKKRYIHLPLLLLAMVSSCTQLSEKWELRRQESDNRKALVAYLKTVQAAASARVVVQIVHADGTRGVTRIFPLKPEELQTLKRILPHTQLIPPSTREATMVTMTEAYFFRLEFLDAAGRVLSGKDPSFTWTSETRMLNLAVDYRHTLMDPTWYLPDADFLTMAKLPTLQAASKWLRR